MAEPVDCSGFCRLCLVKEQVNIPIFEELGDLQQIYLKITACLPIKVSIEDPLPKRICDECSYKLDQQYQFWNTSLNSEKQLRQWLGLPEELPPSKSETSSKIKREKDHYESTTKRPRRNARRKAAQNVRQAAAAAIAAASDSGPGEDMDMDTFGAKEEHDTDNDLNDNTEPLTESTYMNVGIDSEEGTEAGPSGLQKNSDGAANPNQDSSGTGNEEWNIKQEIVEIKQEYPDDQTAGGYLNENGVIKCKICSKTFLNEKRWKTHFNTHLNIRPFSCEFCNKRFKLKTHLSAHLKIHSEDREKYTCEICHKQYATLSSVTRCRKDHTLNFAFTCSNCGKGFHHRSKLDIHYEVNHNAVKQRCEVCNKVFANKINLATHARQHDPNYVIPEFKCEKCGKSYNSRKFYSRHLKSHEGFPCDVCGKVISYEHGLKNHMLIHKGEKPWSCDVCGKSFNQKAILTVHLRTHTNEKPYECKECGKRFTQRSPLVIHMRSHTGEKPYNCRLCPAAFVSKNYLRVHMQSSHNSSDV